MRKLFLTSIVASVCMASGIASEETTIIPTGRLSYLPSFAQDGKGFVYTYSYEDDELNTTRFCIYDEDLQMVKEFVTIPGTPNDYSYQIHERESKPIKATVYNEYKRSEPLSINDESEGLNIEMVLNELNHREPGRWEICIIEDNVQVVASRYYQEEDFGKEYPQIFYQQVDGLWYYYELSYDTEYAPYGEWKEPMTYEGLRYSGIRDIEIIPIDGADQDYFDLTRGIFSEDFNYILPVYIKEEFNNEYTYADTDWVYKKESGYKSRLNGFKAYDSSNKEIASFDLPEGYTCSSEEHPKFLRLGTKRYISIEGDSKAGYYDILYNLDENNKVTPIAIASSTKVSPRTPRQGELVSVTFDESTISSPKSINVVSSSGQNVYKTKLPAGQSSVNIDTSRLNQGIYVVTVSAEGRNQEAAKIIVR